jgi:ectoine hydroxylase-related dioxygenase (phytanoyl-CoA dioxygenase family)
MNLHNLVRRVAATLFDIVVDVPPLDKPTPGLVSLRWTLPRPFPGGHLEFEVLGGPKARVPLPPDAASGAVSLHGHLLPDGRHRLAVRVIDATGRKAGEANREIAVANPGMLGDAVRNSLVKNATPFAVKECDSSHYDYNDDSLVPWFDRQDADETIGRWQRAGVIGSDEAVILRQFVTQGYLVLTGGIERDLIDAANVDIDHAIGRKWQGYEWGSSQRIEHLHMHYEAIRSIWLHPRVLRTLALLFQARPMPCQTLTFVFGSQQDAHQDTVHLTPFPAGYMCGVWVALEDVQPDSGELVVFPGSHRLERVRMVEVGCPKVENDWTHFGGTVAARWRQMIADGGFEPLTYRPKAGDVLIWHENLMHRGSVRIDKSLSRRSVVSHAFAEGSIAYYDSTGKPGHMEPLASDILR